MLLIEHYVAPSPVHGLGVFSNHFVPIGTLVWTSHPIIDREFTEGAMLGLPSHVVKLIERHSEYLPARKIFRLSADGGYFMNHSDDPNLLDRDDKMFARRDILSGDELVCDYRVVKVLGFNPDCFAKSTHHTSIDGS